MRWLRSFALFWYDFIVGDDWRLAVGVVATLGLTWLAAHHGWRAWWLPSAAVMAILVISVLAAVRRRGARGAGRSTSSDEGSGG